MAAMPRAVVVALLALAFGTFGADVAESTGTVALAVTVTGTGYVNLGGGRQVSCGIYAGRPCFARFPVKKGAVVTLRSTSARGSKFSKWSGACTGKSATCVLTVR